MGCGASTAAPVVELASVSNIGSKNQAFLGFLAQENALALAMEMHWLEFIRENDCKRRGDRTSAINLAEARAKIVEVNRYESQAETQQLTFPIVQQVVESFPGYAMTVVEEKGWKNKMLHIIEGGPSSQCTVTVKCMLVFKSAHTSAVYEVPYEVVYSFFVL